MANLDQPHISRRLQVHDRCCTAGARGREEEGAAQVVFGSDGEPVSQQHLHPASPHQRKPHPSRHPAHHPVLFLPQQYAHRYIRSLHSLTRPVSGSSDSKEHCSRI